MTSVLDLIKQRENASNVVMPDETPSLKLENQVAHLLPPRTRHLPLNENGWNLLYERINENLYERIKGKPFTSAIAQKAIDNLHIEHLTNYNGRKAANIFFEEKARELISQIPSEGVKLLPNPKKAIIPAYTHSTEANSYKKMLTSLIMNEMGTIAPAIEFAEDMDDMLDLLAVAEYSRSKGIDEVVLESLTNSERAPPNLSLVAATMAKDSEDYVSVLQNLRIYLQNMNLRKNIVDKYLTEKVVSAVDVVEKHVSSVVANLRSEYGIVLGEEVLASKSPEFIEELIQEESDVFMVLDEDEKSDEQLRVIWKKKGEYVYSDEKLDTKIAPLGTIARVSDSGLIRAKGIDVNLQPHEYVRVVRDIDGSITVDGNEIVGWRKAENELEESADCVMLVQASDKRRFADSSVPSEIQEGTIGVWRDGKLLIDNEYRNVKDEETKPLAKIIQGSTTNESRQGLKVSFVSDDHVSLSGIVYSDYSGLMRVNVLNPDGSLSGDSYSIYDEFYRVETLGFDVSDNELILRNKAQQLGFKLPENSRVKINSHSPYYNVAHETGTIVGINPLGGDMPLQIRFDDGVENRYGYADIIFSESDEALQEKILGSELYSKMQGRESRLKEEMKKVLKKEVGKEYGLQVLKHTEPMIARSELMSVGVPESVANQMVVWESDDSSVAPQMDNTLVKNLESLTPGDNMFSRLVYWCKRAFSQKVRDHSNERFETARRGVYELRSLGFDTDYISKRLSHELVYSADLKRNGII